MVEAFAPPAAAAAAAAATTTTTTTTTTATTFSGPLHVTKKQKEQLDKYGPTPETSIEILFDKVASMPDWMQNAMPDGQWKGFVKDLKEMKKRKKEQQQEKEEKEQKAAAANNEAQEEEEKPKPDVEGNEIDNL